MTENKWIRFERIQVEGRKTPIMFVYSVSSGVKLAEIKWHPAWRQFAFFPEPHTIWNPDCMTGVKEVIASLMLERVNAQRG